MFVNLTKRLFDKLCRKAYRQAYVAEHVATGIAHQIRTLREQRGWNQGKFAAALDKPQSVASRLEDPDYGKYSLTSLLEIAAAFDVALNIRFVSFPDFLRQYSDVTPESFQVESFDMADFVPNAAGDRMLADRMPARRWRRVVVNSNTEESPTKIKTGEIFATVN